LARKGANSPTRGRKLRSTGTKARAHIGRADEPRAELEKKLDARTRELAEARTQLAEARGHLSEALERQTATSEVLQVISSSPGELRPVFDAMLANASTLCAAAYGVLWLREGDAFRIQALHGALPAQQWHTGALYRPAPDVPLGRITRTQEAIHIADMRELLGYQRGDSLSVAAVDVAGQRTLLLVPMVKDSETIGAISIYRTEVSPFSEKQIALLTNFANQAVIAIENTRLLNELRQRTNDLTEALEQQTATSEVLRVISSSPGELKPVFDAMLANATRLCEAKFGILNLRDGEVFQNVALYNVPPAYLETILSRLSCLKRRTAAQRHRRYCRGSAAIGRAGEKGRPTRHPISGRRNDR